MKYGQFVKINNLLQSLSDSVLGVIYFFGIISFMLLLPLGIINYSTEFIGSIFSIGLALYLLMTAFYTLAEVCQPRTEFRKVIQTINLTPPKKFDRNSLIEWWDETEPELASKIWLCAVNLSKSSSVIKSISDRGPSYRISHKELEDISVISKEAVLITNMYNFYQSMEGFTRPLILSEEKIPAN